MEKKKILVVEDEKTIAQVIVYNLMKEGYEVENAYDGEDGLAKALRGDFDLILDIMLPKMDGFEVSRRIRTQSAVPIIFCTAREDEKDKIFGLDTGGDDYVTKPFSVKELVARIKSNIRRSTSEVVYEKKVMDSSIRIGEIEIDCMHYSASKAGVPYRTYIPCLPPSQGANRTPRREWCGGRSHIPRGRPSRKAKEARQGWAAHSRRGRDRPRATRDRSSDTRASR